MTRFSMWITASHLERAFHRIFIQGKVLELSIGSTPPNIREEQARLETFSNSLFLIL